MTDDGPTPSMANVADLPHHGWVLRVWHGVRRYPLPFVTLMLLVVGLPLWIARRGDLANTFWAVAIVTGGVPLLWETAQQLLHRKFGVDVLALIAISGSFVLREFLAGAIIVLMLSGGEALEAFALRRARRSLTGLAERAPRIAHVPRGEELVTVPAGDIEVGGEVVVKAGELLPVDGVVIRGESSVSEADLTGEPIPAHKVAGSQVLSGSVNLDGVLYVRATKRAAESQYALIVKLVREAEERRAPIHRLADQYAAWFTALALSIAAVAWIVSGDSLYALAVVVVATPCPLILATPIAIMSGINRAATLGIIVKSGTTIEQLGDVSVAVFDKTGTLTLGHPQFVGFEMAERATGDGAVGVGGAPEEAALLVGVAAVEQFSPHILARAVVEAAHERGLPLHMASEVEEVAGKGIRGRVSMAGQTGEAMTMMAREDMRDTSGAQKPVAGEAENRRIVDGTVEVAVGNATYMRLLEIGVPAPLTARRATLTAEGQIASFVAVERRAVGLVVFADGARPELERLVPELKVVGIQETVLLTGDGEVVAKQIAERAGVDRVVAQCLPEDKSRIVEELEWQRRHVMMIGDGVNDAPALATATVGIAMGAQGLTAAAAAADAVLLGTDLLRIPQVVRLGRHTMHIAKQGIWVGIGLSVCAMVAAALGYLPPTAGALLQEGIDVIVIANALRAGRT